MFEANVLASGVFRMTQILEPTGVTILQDNDVMLSLAVGSD